MNKLNIVIVDYGVGNTRSIWNTISSLGYSRLKISAVAVEILAADALILPGVGAFEFCMKNLRKHHLDSVLHQAVVNKEKPILGICVGMQLMSTVSEENGEHFGLDWIPGRVVKLRLSESCPVPHVGWNNIRYQKDNVLFSNGLESPNFYFDHSYHFQGDGKYITAQCEYGFPIAAAIGWENIHGVQFHPEKSQTNGLKLFRSFFNAID